MKDDLSMRDIKKFCITKQLISRILYHEAIISQFYLLYAS